MDSADHQPRRTRLDAIDALRGLVMVFMCLDHAREYFFDLRLQPEDLATTTPLLFATRWITHFCAPTFVFLAGTSAWLYQQKVNSRPQLARLLCTRGLWLIFLEFTVVYFGWLHSLWPFPLMFIVIAAIGFCMIALSGLIFLPVRVLLPLGLLIVGMHNTLDSVEAASLGRCSWVWTLLHDGGPIDFLYMSVGYPVLPWIGVILCGYCFGAILQHDREKRRGHCLQIGVVCVLSFLILRAMNVYGDPAPRMTDGTWQTGVMSFLRCTKYPPSLLYLLMTLGPALIVLGLFDGPTSTSPRTAYSILLAFGRVPLFFYVVHLYLIHGCSRIVYGIVHGDARSPLATAFHCFSTETEFPAHYGFPLWVTYAAWIVMLLILWPLCLWFGRRKRQGHSVLWSYL